MNVAHKSWHQPGVNSAINEHGWLAGVAITNPDHLEGPTLEGPPDLPDLGLVREADGEAVQPRVDSGKVLVTQPVHVSGGTWGSA